MSKFKVFTVFLMILLANQLQAAGFQSRLDDARQNCLRRLPIYKTVDIEEIAEGEKYHYRNSRIQSLFSPIHGGIVDQFGSLVQGLLSGGDEAIVRPSLRYLAKDAKKVMQKRKLSKHQAVCLASCMTNNLLRPEDVNPMLSFDMALAEGQGFCRHFSKTTKYLLDHMGVKTKLGTSLDHMYLMVKSGRILRIFDPSISNGNLDCTFYKTP